MKEEQRRFDAAGRREAGRQIFAAALAAAEPAAAVRAHLRRDGERLLAGDAIYDLSRFQRVLIAGAGKAGAAMSAAVVELLGDRIADGVVVVKEGHAAPVPGVRVYEAGHPTPDAAGVAATRELLALVATAGPDDLILCPISGGGSALLVAPAPPLALADKRALTDVLLRAGCTINEINAVRKHCSAVKGGQLARAANGAALLTVLLSDVVGNPLDVIASGPTVPDPTTYADALAVLDRYDLRARVPLAVRERLEAGLAGAIPETPKPGDPCFLRAQALLVGSVELACAAAAREAAALGYAPVLLTAQLQGEAREVAATLVLQARAALAERAAGPVAFLAGGETTVTVRGDGKGGRNQEFAVAAALAVQGDPRLTVAALATDGGDGPTDAAGAIVDGATIALSRERGLDATATLARNDAYPFLDAVGALVRTGPTGTNVNDLILILAGE